MAEDLDRVLADFLPETPGPLGMLLNSRGPLGWLAGLIERRHLELEAEDVAEGLKGVQAGEGAAALPASSLGGTVADRFRYLPKLPILVGTKWSICSIKALPVPEINTLPAPIRSLAWRARFPVRNGMGIGISRGWLEKKLAKSGLVRWLS